MTPHPTRRLGRGENLHRVVHDVQTFGEWLLFAVSVVALAAGVAYIVAVFGFGASPWFPLEWIA